MDLILFLVYTGMYNNRKFCMLGNVWKSWGWLSGGGTWDNRMMVMHLITFGLVRVDIHVKQTKERETGPDLTVVYTAWIAQTQIIPAYLMCPDCKSGDLCGSLCVRL